MIYKLMVILERCRSFFRNLEKEASEVVTEEEYERMEDKGRIW